MILPLKAFETIRQVSARGVQVEASFATPQLTMKKKTAVLYALSIKKTAPHLSPTVSRVGRREYELQVNGLRTQDWLVARAFERWLREAK